MWTLQDLSFLDTAASKIDIFTICVCKSVYGLFPPATLCNRYHYKYLIELQVFVLENKLFYKMTPNCLKEGTHF